MNLLLAPVPQQLDLTGGTLTLTPGRRMVLDGNDAAAAIVAARVLRDAISTYAGVDWHLTDAEPGSDVGLTARIDAHTGRPEGYRLTIGAEGIDLTAHDAAGLAYGCATLTQLVRQCGGTLPQLHIEDYSDFPSRGVMLDISRDKVPTMATLFGLIDMLAEWKINQFQFNLEHTFAYEAHPLVWEHASPMSGDEIRALDDYCRDRHIELVANQNSFGHMERWLTKEPYREMAEVPEGVRLPHRRLLLNEPDIFPTTLNPCNPRSAAFIDGLYGELLPHYRSERLNVGCDETWELGRGGSKAACEERGVGRVYLEFLLKIHALCGKYGRRMMFWGDIVTRHPELIAELPRDATLLQWGYEHDAPFDHDSRLFAEAGVPFYVCPATGGVISLIGRTDNAVANIRNAATNGLRHGAAGVLNTDWGDFGHLQPLPVSYLGLLYGASMSWSSARSEHMDIASALSLQAFDDPSDVSGRAAFDLGNVHQITGARSRNGAILAQMYVTRVEGDTLMADTRPGGFEDASAALNEIAGRFDAWHMRRPDGPQIVDEYRCAAEMADIGAAIGAVKQRRTSGAARPELDAAYLAAARRIDAVIPEYERLWLARNRPGGLRDSTARLRTLSANLRAAAAGG